MRSSFRSLAALLLLGASFSAAAERKDTPFGQAATPAVVTGGVDAFEFSGVSTVGKRTMINLFDKQQKKSFWVEAGTTSNGVTVVSYDNAKDQVTIRSNGAEKLLPLRPPSAVVNGTTPTVVATITPTPVPVTPAPAATPPPPATAPTTQARQEEEARMLVSDLLEIGMAQRRAYEEAQRKAAGGQNTQATATAQSPTPTGATTATTPSASASTGQK